MADDGKDRFVTLSTEEFSKVIDNKDSNTPRGLHHSQFTRFELVCERSLDEKIENMSVHELDLTLAFAKFYAEP